MHWLSGSDLTEDVWDAFFEFYMETGSRKWGRPAPFARAGLHVEFEEGVPNVFREIAAGQPMHSDAVFERLAPLALDGLALAR